MAKSGRYIGLDLFKFFLCYLVICIHLASETYAHFPLYRLAVPTFFMISGYFSRPKDGENEEEKARRFIIRNLRYLLIGLSINIAFDFVWCYHEGMGVGYYFTTLFYEDFLLEFFILNRPVTYVGAQIWFLIALFVVSLIHYLLTHCGKLHWYKVLVPVCFFIYFFFSAYMHFFQETDMPIRYMRNALFFGLPNFGLGYLLSGKNFHKRSWYKYGYLALGVVLFFLQIAEHTLLHTEYESLEMFVSGVLSGACFLLFFTGCKSGKGNWFYRFVGRNGSFYVYVFHMAVAVALGWFISIPNALLRSFVVLVISFLLYEICFWVEKLIKRKKSSKNLS